MGPTRNRARTDAGEEVPQEDHLGTSRFDPLYLKNHPWVRHL